MGSHWPRAHALSFWQHTASNLSLLRHNFAELSGVWPRKRRVGEAQESQNQQTVYSDNIASSQSSKKRWSPPWSPISLILSIVAQVFVHVTSCLDHSIKPNFPLGRQPWLGHNQWGNDIHPINPLGFPLEQNQFSLQSKGRRALDRAMDPLGRWLSFPFKQSPQNLTLFEVFANSYLNATFSLSFSGGFWSG